MRKWNGGTYQTKIIIGTSEVAHKYSKEYEKKISTYLKIRYKNQNHSTANNSQNVFFGSSNEIKNFSKDSTHDASIRNSYECDNWAIHSSKISDWHAFFEMLITIRRTEGVRVFN